MYSTTRGTLGYRFIAILTFFSFLGCSDFKKCNQSDSILVVNQYSKNYIDFNEIEDAFDQSDTIDAFFFKIPLEFITRKEFLNAIKRNCNYRSFSYQSGKYIRFNEYKDKNVHRLNKDSLFFNSENTYLIDGRDKTRFFCDQSCDIKYFLEEIVGSFYLVKVLLPEEDFSLLLTDSLYVKEPLDLYPTQTIFNRQRKLLFSADYYPNFSESTEITFYKLRKNEIIPILRLRMKNRMIIGSFFSEDYLFFIFKRNDKYYFSKMKIPSKRQFDLVTEVRREMILDSLPFIPPPK